MQFVAEEVIYHSALFAIGALIATCRVITEHSNRNCWDYFAIGVQGGFWSFGICGILGYYNPELVNNRWLGLATSSLVGLAGKEQDKYLRLLLRVVWSKLGLPPDDSENVKS